MSELKNPCRLVAIPNMKEEGSPGQESITSALHECADRLRTGDIASRIEACQELTRWGIWGRDGTNTRGTYLQVAEERGPADVLSVLREAFHSPDQELVREVALAIGEWGGEAACHALETRLETEKEPKTRAYLIAGLTTLGGPPAVRALCQAVRHDKDLADAALSGLIHILTGGSTEDGSGPPPPIRLQTMSRESATLVSDLARLLEDVLLDPTRSEYIRARASDVLRELDTLSRTRR